MLTPALLLALSVSAQPPPSDPPAAVEPHGAASAVTAPPLVELPEVTAPEVAAPEPAAGPRPLGKVRGVERFRYRERDGVPEGYRLVSQPRWTLFGGGVGALAGGYLVAVGLAAFRVSGLGFIPVAGPIIQLVLDWSNFSWASGSFSGIANFFLAIGMFLYSALAVVASAAQVIGPLMMWRSHASPERWLEKDAPAVRVAVMPGTATSPLGVSLVGLF